MLPIRASLLLLNLIGLIGFITFLSFKSQQLEFQQKDSTRLVGQPVWHVSLPIRDTFQERIEPINWNATDWLSNYLEQANSIIFIRSSQPMQLRFHDGIQFHSSTIIFASPALGLPAMTVEGDIACTWLDNRADNTTKLTEVIFENGLRCKLLSRPSGWSPAATEWGGNFLVLHTSHIHTFLGNQWVQQIFSILVGENKGCDFLLKQSNFQFDCKSALINHSLAQDSQEEIEHAKNAFSWVALASFVIAILIYLHGFFPLLMSEVALRMVLGHKQKSVYVWGVSELLLQLIFLLMPLIALRIILPHLGLNFSHFIQSGLVICVGVTALLVTLVSLFQFYFFTRHALIALGKVK
nr:hypothetical protein [uncultured Undibacterium sp.]